MIKGVEVITNSDVIKDGDVLEDGKVISQFEVSDSGRPDLRETPAIRGEAGADADLPDIGFTRSRSRSG